MPTIDNYIFTVDGLIFLVSLLRLFVLLFQSLSHIMDASMEDLARCPGIGERKVFFDCFLSYIPFLFFIFTLPFSFFFYCLVFCIVLLLIFGFLYKGKSLNWIILRLDSSTYLNNNMPSIEDWIWLWTWTLELLWAMVRNQLWSIEQLNEYY